MVKKKVKYSIGLDLGTTSVGWACIGDNFQVLKYQDRYAMGTREFSAAETAEQRRIQRGTRRRYNRRRKRLQLLQETLAPIFKNDIDFFRQTDEMEKHFWKDSNYFENRSLSEVLHSLGKNTRKYPTIYHLKHDIISKEEKFDPKLIYLALHHLVKFRGHFLNENITWKKADEKESIIENIQIYFKVLEEHSFQLKDSPISYKTIENILKDKTQTASDRRRDLLKITGKEFNAPMTLITGLKADMSKLFPESPNIDIYKKEKLKLSFSDEDITEVYEKLTDEEKIVINQANIIYQNIILHELLGDSFYVSEAKVNDYNKFGTDLALLKRIYNDFLGEKEYKDMFITSRKNQKEFDIKRDYKLLCKFDQFLKAKKLYEDSFYKHLEKVMKFLIESGQLKEKEQNLIKDVLREIEINQFLQKQKSYLNAAIPHQNNVYEAKMILKKQQNYYPEITDEMIKKVIDIISFRIPYYIGPLVKENDKGDFGWLVRKKQSVPILPWNFDNIIDRSTSAEKFIDRMTNYCMYLKNEKVLPKHSLVYERFEVINELNGIQIRSKQELKNNKYRLDKVEKEWIIKNLFEKRKSISTKLLRDTLNKSSDYRHIILDNELDGLKEIYGAQKEDKFSTNLSTYIDMKNIFGDINDSNFIMIEELIYWITVFEDKKILRIKIEEKYPQITDSQIQKLMRLNYSGWGRLSNKLLNELPVDSVNNKTMIEVMLETPKVFMEVLSIEKYDLNNRISKMNKDIDNRMRKITYEDILDLQGSPAIKKAIWQSIQIIEELVDIFGEPDNIMIEFAREDGPKKRTEDRKKRLDNVRKAISKDEKELKEFLAKHSRYDVARYRDQRLYLYITQEGKCLYSGEPLNIDRLHEYEVDHIFPRSFVPDNSIDNLALVKYEMNQAKDGTKMPLQIISSINRVKQISYWTKLFNNNLISQKKYYRLMKEEFTEQDKESFFARQLVETRQITKHVKDLLEERFENTNIHTVNAEIVSKLRSHSNIMKIRDINNKHHAIDAALAIVVVQFIIKNFGHNFLDFNFKYQEAQKKWKKQFKQYGKNFFLFSAIDKYEHFHHYETGEVLSGREYFRMLNDELPWQTTRKIGTEEAAFYKQTLHSPRTRIAKYKSAKTKTGIYDDMKNDCSYLISYKERDKKGKVIKKSEIVDFYVIEKYQQKSSSNKEFALYLANKLTDNKIVDAVIHTKIQKYQLIEYNDHLFYYVSSREMQNAKQLLLDSEVLQQLYKILNSKKHGEIDVEFLKNTFERISSVVINEYDEFIYDSTLDIIKNYVAEIVDLDTFKKGVMELFKVTSASALRSTVFKSRYQKKVNPQNAKFFYQSLTGLRRRKPRSFRNELWSL